MFSNLPVLLFQRINEDKIKHLYPILFYDEKQTLRIKLANTFFVIAVVTIVTLLVKFHWAILFFAVVKSIAVVSDYEI